MLDKFLKILFDVKSPKRGLISFTGFVLLAALILSFAVSYHLAHSHKRLIYSVEKVKSELTLAHLQKSDKLLSDYFDDDTSLANSKKHLDYILKSKSWGDAFIPVISAKQIAEIESILKKIAVFDSLVHQNLNLNLEKRHNTLFISLIEDINTLQNEMNVTYNFQDKASQTVYIISLFLFLVYIMAVIYVINKHTKIRDVLIAQQNRLTDTIKSIEKNINIKIGDDYYISLVLELNKQFKADYIIISNYNKKEHASTSLAYLNKQRVLENITYGLAHTPCEIALKKGYVFYGSNLTKIFNKDKYLKVSNIESYIGIVVRNESNQVVGHLVVMYCKPIIEEEHYKLLMQIFADKIGKEFVRNRLLGELNVKKKELQKAQEIAQLGSYVIDFKTGQISFSNIAGRIIGAKQKDSFKLINWRNMIHPDDLLRYQKETTKNIKNKEHIDLEYRIFTKDTNELKWVHCVSQLNYKDGKPDAITGIIQDISQRKIAQQDLLESEKSLKVAHDITGLGTFTFDGRISKFKTSAIFDKIVGVEANYLDSIQKLVTLSPPNDCQYLDKLFYNKELTEIKQEFRIERPKDKAIIWIYLNARKVYDKNFKLKSITGTIQDITQRKLTEEKIKRSDAILQKLDTIVLVVNKEAKITYLSPSVKDILGYKYEDLLGDKWWELTFEDPDMANKSKEKTLRYFKDHTPIFKDSTRKTKLKNGDYKWISWHKSNAIEDSLIYLGIDVTDKYNKEIQHKTITETANDAIVISDEKAIIIEWNKAAIKMFGYTKKEIIGKELSSIMPKKYRVAHAKGFNTSAKKGVINNNSLRILEGLKKDKTIFPIEISFNSWKMGRRGFYCAFIRDISERQREEHIKNIIYNITVAAQKNLKLETLLRFIKKSLSVVIDTDNFYVALYDAEKQNFSLPYIAGKDAALKGKSFPLGKSLTAYVLRKECTTVLTHVEFETLAKKGEVKLVGKPSKIWVGIPLIENNKVIGLMAVQSFTDEEAFTQKDIDLMKLVAINISQVIKHAQDLDKINLLNTALIQSPASVVITDIYGNIEYVNPTFTKWSGYSYEEALGQNPRILKSGVQDDAYYKNLWNTITRGKLWKGEFINKRKDGSQYLVSVNMSAVKDASGEITHFIGIQEDITEKRQLERNYIYAFIEAQEAEKEHFGEELHDGISQILAAEAMYIEILIRQNKDRLDGKAKYLYKVKELNLSAIEDARNISHGLMSKQLKEQGLIIAVAHICDNFSKSKDINFKFTCKDLIEADISKEIKTNLFRVAQEISTNIVRHAAAKKAFINFEKLPNNRLKLRIKDDGVGIDLDKIKKEKKGAGLKNIERRITLLGGKINIESQVNKGTCFTIEVPLERI